jgi:hypothetical protein
MAALTTEQAAELLLGIARAQLAMADAMESAKAGFKSTHLRPQVESAARIKVNRPESLADFPSRLLLQMFSRNPPTIEAVTKDLQALVDGSGAPVVLAPDAPVMAAAPAAPAAPGGMSLDMT